MSVLVSFGQTHTHSINGITIDKDCIVKVESRKRALELFGEWFCFTYTADCPPRMEFFPRGVIDLTSSPQP